MDVLDGFYVLFGVFLGWYLGEHSSRKRTVELEKTTKIGFAKSLCAELNAFNNEYYHFGKHLESNVGWVEVKRNPTIQ